MYDVIIIGAGPAGSAAAFDLAAAGKSVLILDRRRFPRKKACAGGITPKAMDLFAYDISHLVVRTCHHVRISRPRGPAFTISDARPLCYMTRRRDLDAYALDKAVAAGARFMQISSISALAQDREGVTLFLKKGGSAATFRAGYLLGADGANSRIRTLLGRPLMKIDRYPALEADVRVDRPGVFPMEFDFSRGIEGYYWIFPKDDHVNIGIYGAAPGVSVNRQLLGAYARERLGSDRLEAVKGYPIGTGLCRTCAGRGRVLLAGDAAGMAEPLFGEGIYFALKSGRLAARAILEGSPAPLARYKGSLARVALDLGFHTLGARTLYRFPRISLGLASRKWFHNYFSRGYARGKTISQIFLGG